jgi:hypothetical protein
VLERGGGGQPQVNLLPDLERRHEVERERRDHTEAADRDHRTGEALVVAAHPDDVPAGGDQFDRGHGRREHPVGLP